MVDPEFMRKPWFHAIYLTALSVYGYIFMEWVFFATKTSFLSPMGFLQKTDSLLVACFISALPALILTAAALLMAARARFFLWAAAAVPALAFAALSLILFDNFTYTVFKFGIVNTQGLLRGGYTALFLSCFAWYLAIIHKRLITGKAQRPGPEVYSFLVVMLVSLLVFVSHLGQFNFNAMRSGKAASNTAELPDIILLGFDGVNATHMSVYGYDRTTTPNIEALAGSALVAENAFSNSGATGGSLAALLTGRLPTETRVIYPPDILLGEDSYKHLPGLLKQAGYTTVQITLPHYGDAYSMNLQGGFDVANSRSQGGNPLLDRLNRIGGGGGFYLVAQVLERILDRLGHIFYIKTMENPYLLVTEPASNFSEEARFDAVTSYIQETPRPMFLHVHMMATHGGVFFPREAVYSAGQTQDAPWMTDFYDDAILDADQYVNQLFRLLRRRDRLNNTIVILFSDHGMKWNSRDRIPLIIWFPRGEHAGRLTQNVQLIDVAPTLLDYLEMGQPDWMHGESLLADGLSPSRRIFSAQPASELISLGEDGFSLDQDRVIPPFYQMGALNLVVCDQWFMLNLRTPALSRGRVDGSTAVCDPADIPSPEAAKTLMLERLAQDGYDVSDFPVDIPILAP